MQWPGAKRTHYLLYVYKTSKIYVKELTGYEAIDWASVFCQKSTLAFVMWSATFFEVITDISSDAESCAEQYGAMGATTAKLWPLF